VGCVPANEVHWLFFKVLSIRERIQVRGNAGEGLGCAVGGASRFPCPLNLTTSLEGEGIGVGV